MHQTGYPEPVSRRFSEKGEILAGCTNRDTAWRHTHRQLSICHRAAERSYSASGIQQSNRDPALHLSNAIFQLPTICTSWDARKITSVHEKRRGLFSIFQPTIAALYWLQFSLGLSGKLFLAELGRCSTAKHAVSNLESSIQCIWIQHVRSL